MTVDAIITTGQDKAHVNTDQVSAANGLKYLNLVYHDLCSAIRQYVGEDFFFDLWSANAVSGQTNGEYVFPQPDASNAGMAKLKQLSVKVRSTDTYFTKARQVDLRNLAYDWDWYLANQPIDEPIYYVADDSFFLAPQFTASTVGSGDNAQLKLYGVKREIDLLAAGAETTILVPREYHNALIKGVKAHCFDHIGKDAEQSKAFAEYEADKLKALSELSDRDSSLGQATLPSDVDLQ